MTLFVIIEPGNGDKGPSHSHWRPWINCGDLTQEDKRELSERLALNRYLRESGELAAIKRGGPRHTCTLYSYTDQDPTWESGKPKKVKASTYIVGP